MALNAGDIAIVAYNADGTKAFSFVALTDVPASEEIKFTDNGWTGAPDLRTGEGTITWLAPTGGVSKGTVVTITTNGAGAAAASVGSVTESGDLNISASGDQLLAFQGPHTAATWLFAINNEGAGVWQSTADSSNTSGLPPGLTGANLALGEIDNSAYGGPTTGTRSELLAAITNPGNWSGSDTVNATAPASFVVTGPTTGTTISVSDVAVVEGDAGAAILNFTVTRSDNSGAFTVDYATQDGTATGADYTGASGTLSFSAGGELSLTVSVTIIGDTAVEADETLTLTLSNVVDITGTATIADASATGTISNDDVVVTRIHAIQGSGETSPLVGQIVTVDAIIVGDFQNGDADDKRNLNGFYLQQADADTDGDAGTSEGIFVFQGSFPGAVQNGDRVQVTGTVEEYFGMTQIGAVSAITVIYSGNPLPTAAQISLPAAGVSLSQDGDYQPDLEAFEGMLVELPETLTITEQFQLDRFNEIKLVEGARPAQFTHENAPDAAGYEEHRQAVGARTITYDDGLNVQNAAVNNLDGFGPVYDTATAPRMGDTVTGLTGVLDYQWAGNAASGSTWRVRSIEDGANEFVSGPTPREAEPADVGGRLKVGSFNVLNLFATIDTVANDSTSNSNSSDDTALGFDPRGADSSVEFERQMEKLVNVIRELDADVLGLLELENDFLDNAPGNAVDVLVDRLNAVAGSGTYAWVDPGGQFVGTDAISVGYIYKPGVVQIAPGTSVAVLDDAALPGLGLASLLAQSTVGALFDGVNTSRNPIAVTWQEIATGEQFTTAANHFKSKGGTGTGADADASDGAGAWNNQRLLAAMAVDAWLQTNPTGTADGDYIILGDLNAYFQEDPIEYLVGQGYTNLQEALSDNPYSYVFDGQIGSLDYILANDKLFLEQIVGLTEWHINADEADALDYNTDFGRDTGIFDASSLVRVSDHDPLLVGLFLNDLDNVFLGSAVADRIRGGLGDDLLDGQDAADMLDGGSGDDSIYGGYGDDVIMAGDGRDSVFALTGQDTIFGGSGEDGIAGEGGNDQISGEAGADYLLGGDGDDTIDGGADGDAVFGGSSYDVIYGGDGDDSIDGGDDIDLIFGGGGADYIFGGEAGDEIEAGQGNDFVFGGAGIDVIRGGEGDDGLDGGADTDYLYGDSGTDWLFGQDGDDGLFGGDDNDVLFGGAGIDSLYGQSGADRLDGGAGDDILIGGEGSDVFSFGTDWGNDRIDDFEDGIDAIDIVDPALNSFDQLVITQVGADALVTFAGNSITIVNTQAATLTQADVLGNGLPLS